MSLEDRLSVHYLWEGHLAYPLQMCDRSDLTFLLTEDEIISKERKEGALRWGTTKGHYDERAFSERMDSTFRYCQITS